MEESDAPSRLLVVANRLPLTIKKSTSGSWEFVMSSGGLVAALSALKTDYIWVGWPGTEVAEEDREEVKQKLWDSHRCVPVFLEHKLAEAHYNGFSNGILWPLFHYNEDFQFSADLWKQYQVANKQFSEVVTKIAQKSDLVHDYHLMLMPAYLRQMIPSIAIDIPFPSSEVYKKLPVRRDLLEALLQSDLIGFHTFDYARHFTKSCTRILGLETTPTQVTYRDNVVPVGLFPVGIDPKKFYESLQSVQVKNRIQELKEKFGDRKILIGIDRLDYIKGIPQKLHGFERFLRTRPEYASRVCLIQIAVPSRIDVPEYAKLKQEVEELVSSINSRYGGVGFNPIHYLFKSVDFTELTSLYYLADAALITSIRDGMNLVSLEYVACQKERHGVLVLSEFAGCAGVMNGALRINPWSSYDTATAIYDALTMPEEERSSRHMKLLRWVEKHTASYWGTSFVEELKNAASSARQPSKIPSLWRSPYAVQHAAAKQRLILLTYDGILVPFTALPELARPSRELLSLLNRLSSDPRNVVFIHSGRSSNVLEQWFVGADRVGLSAEDGYYMRYPGETEWKALDAQLDLGWREVLKPVFEYFAERTPGSFIEEKELALTWHYRNADVDFGRMQANELQLHLDNFYARLPITIEVRRAHKLLEVHPREVSNQTLIRRLVTDRGLTPDVILCVGDIGVPEESAVSQKLAQTSIFRVLVERKAAAENMYGLRDSGDVIAFLSSIAPPPNSP